MRLFRNRADDPERSWSVFRWHEIRNPKDGTMYLLRFNLIRCPWFSVKLHWIYQSDADRQVHDHPWHFVSFVLRGGYTERVVHISNTDNTIELDTVEEVRHMSAKKAWHAHRILRLRRSPTVTLVLTGRRVRRWGFWERVPGKPFNVLRWVHWKEYTTPGRVNLHDWWRHAVDRHGSDAYEWPFICPSCGQEQTGRHFALLGGMDKAYIDQVLGFSCIGNWQKHLGNVVEVGTPTTGLGCKYNGSEGKLAPIMLGLGQGQMRPTFRLM